MKITKELLREMIKEEIAALKEEKSFFGRFKYAPAELLMRLEREVRRRTGLRGVLDTSVIYDNEGNLIIPEPDKLKDWQKDYPALYAATQAATNIFASDPLSLATTLIGGVGLAGKAASKLSKVAKITKGYTPTITKGVDTATRLGRGAGIAKSTFQGATKIMNKNGVPAPIQREVGLLYDQHLSRFLKSGKASAVQARAKDYVYRGLKQLLRSKKATEGSIRGYQQFIETLGNKFPELGMRFSNFARTANNRLLRMYADPKQAAQRLPREVFKGPRGSYRNTGGIHDWHLLPEEQLVKLKDVINGTHEVDWNTLTVVAKRGFGG
jgi:hypothetical protein